MKILFVCESFSSKLSGGKVVRYLHKILTSNGHSVKIAITSPFNELDTWIAGGEKFITAIPTKTRYYWRLYSLIDAHDVSPEFTRLVDEFAPDVVHFASFDHAKSPNLYRYCKSRNIRIVLQPWTMHFYCAQGFGYRGNQQCTLCIDCGFSTAITQGCASLRGVVGQLERSAFGRVLQRCRRFVARLTAVSDGSVVQPQRAEEVRCRHQLLRMRRAQREQELG